MEDNISCENTQSRDLLPVIKNDRTSGNQDRHRYESCDGNYPCSFKCCHRLNDATSCCAVISDHMKLFLNATFICNACHVHIPYLSIYQRGANLKGPHPQQKTYITKQEWNAFALLANHQLLIVFCQQNENGCFNFNQNMESQIYSVSSVLLNIVNCVTRHTGLFLSTLCLLTKIMLLFSLGHTK